LPGPVALRRMMTCGARFAFNDRELLPRAFCPPSDLHFQFDLSEFSGTFMSEEMMFDLDDLKKLSRDVEKAIASFEDRKRREARKAMEKVAREYGLSVEDVVGTQKAAARASKSP
jgi:hypothetical protein